MMHRKFFTWLFVLGTFSSCALQQASTGLTKYQQAMLCYESKNYSEALSLFEEAIPLLQEKREEASAYFHKAYCGFHQKSYVASSDHFKYFYKTFPRDHRAEEAMYMRGHVLYLNSPDVRLDQTCTQEAARVLRSYLDSYPDGAYANKARSQLRELDDKLALKDFNSAKLYYQLAYYRAAVVTLENFQKDFADSSLHEEAAYLKASAQHRYYFEEIAEMHKHAGEYNSKNSDQGKIDMFEGEPQGVHSNLGQKDDQEDHLRMAVKYCREFLDRYPDSRYALAVGNIYESLLLVDKS